VFAELQAISAGSADRNDPGGRDEALGRVKAGGWRGAARDEDNQASSSVPGAGVVTSNLR